MRNPQTDISIYIAGNPSVGKTAFLGAMPGKEAQSIEKNNYFNIKNDDTSGISFFDINLRKKEPTALDDMLCDILCIVIDPSDGDSEIQCVSDAKKRGEAYCSQNNQELSAKIIFIINTRNLKGAMPPKFTQTLTALEKKYAPSQKFEWDEGTNTSLPTIKDHLKKLAKLKKTHKEYSQTISMQKEELKKIQKQTLFQRIKRWVKRLLGFSDPLLKKFSELEATIEKNNVNKIKLEAAINKPTPHEAPQIDQPVTKLPVTASAKNNNSPRQPSIAALKLGQNYDISLSFESMFEFDPAGEQEMPSEEACNDPKNISGDGMSTTSQDTGYHSTNVSPRFFNLDPILKSSFEPLSPTHCPAAFSTIKKR